MASTSARTQLKPEKRRSVDWENIMVGKLMKSKTLSPSLSSWSQELARIASSPVMKLMKNRELATHRETTANIAKR